jgi:hypothetical protein
MLKATQSGISKPRILRGVGIFVLGPLVAAILENALRRLVPVHSLVRMVAKHGCLDPVVAAFMGLMTYRAERCSPSNLPRTSPASWFTSGAQTSRPHTRANSVLVKRESVWTQFSGEGCCAAATDCPEFFVFSVPLTRASARSAAALLASPILGPATSLTESDDGLKNPSYENPANS